MGTLFLGILRVLASASARTLATLFGLLLLVVYLLGTLHMNREGERQLQISGLHRKILTFVQHQQQPGSLSLDDLHRAGCLSEDDVRFLQAHQIVYHPVGAGSPDNAVVLTETSREGERYYYKNGRSDFTLVQRSPDEALAFQNGPRQGKTSGWRTVRITDHSGNLVGTCDVEAISLTAQWSPGSRLIALSRSLKGNVRRALMLALIANGLKEVPLPEDLTPAHFLPPQDAARGVRWYSDEVMIKHWLGPRDLVVENYGGATVGNPRARPLETVNLRYRFVLHVNEDATIQVRERRRISLSHTRGREVVWEK